MRSCGCAVVAQWADEVRKFAPQLKVVMHYGNSKRYDAVSCGKFDVVISSPHMKLDSSSAFKLHRLIVDVSAARAAHARGRRRRRRDERVVRQLHRRPVGVVVPGLRLRRARAGVGVLRRLAVGRRRPVQPRAVLPPEVEGHDVARGGRRGPPQPAESY